MQPSWFKIRLPVIIGTACRNLYSSFNSLNQDKMHCLQYLYQYNCLQRHEGYKRDYNMCQTRAADFSNSPVSGSSWKSFP